MNLKKEKQKTTVFGLEIGAELDMNINMRLFKWVGVLVGEIMILLLITFLVVVPKFKEAYAVRRDFEKQEKLLSDLQSKLETLEEFGVVYANDELASFVFPRSKDVGLLLSSIRQIANETGVSIESYSLEPGVIHQTDDAVERKKTTNRNRPGDVVEYDVELVVTGFDKNMERFIRLTDESLPLKKIDDITVSLKQLASEESVEEIEIVTTKLLIKSYYMPVLVSPEIEAPLASINEVELLLQNELKSYKKPAVFSGAGNLPVGNSNLFGL